MPTLIRTITASVAAAFAFGLPLTAGASLVYDSTIEAPAQGFGTAPRDLTLQATGGDILQSGGIGISSTGVVEFGSVIQDSQVYLGNGHQNESGVSSLPQPREIEGAKYGVPTLGALGITTANQIAVLFNADEPAGDSINVLDVTLKFYSGLNVFLGAIDGSHNFIDSNAGNGVAGFTFIIDALQQLEVNKWIAMGGAATQLALEASFADFAGGPESFLIYKLGTTEQPTPPTDQPAPPTDVPEPTTIALLGAGFGLIALLNKRRRRSQA